MKTDNYSEFLSENAVSSDDRLIETVRCSQEDDDPAALNKRADDDPMKLYNQVISLIKDYFLKRNLTFVSGQLETLEDTTETVLSAISGTVHVVSLNPGGGKSTMLRALFLVLACVFADMTSPIARRLGGVILVVEKSAEAHEYSDMCNQVAGKQVAAVIESANDSVLRHGGCVNGSATRYSECRKRNCPDYESCSLMQAMSHTQETPILILLHARYERHMEQMDPFLEWYDQEGNSYSRSLLLVDELPPIIEPNAIDLPALNDAESEVDRIKPSYNIISQREKQDILRMWEKSVRQPFKRLVYSTNKISGKYRLIDRNDFKAAGFNSDDLKILRQKLIMYADSTLAEQIVKALTSDDHAYFSIGQTMVLTLPRLKTLHGPGRPATIIFSGSAALSPEVTRNPNITIQPDQTVESFQRLTIKIQRGDDFGISRTALSRIDNLQALIAWLEHVLDSLVVHHKKIMVVTYKQHAQTIWRALHRFHSSLIPYIDADGCPLELLPYFGGVQGSNLYQEATAVVCAGLNRFDAQDYLSRALAVDIHNKIPDEFEQIQQSGKHLRLDQIDTVMDAQDITLARDIVQLIFRSALRRHGGTEPIEPWLIQPPNGLVGYLQEYFVDCKIEEVGDLPQTCVLAALKGQSYNGRQPHWSRLLEWLLQWNGTEVTPDEIRAATGLTPAQFKEARRHKRVQAFFDQHVESIGSGRHARYRHKPDLSTVA